MNESQIYIAISIGILAVILVMVVFIGRKKQQARLSKLATLSFLLVITGIVFGESRFIGYSLMGSGVLLAVIDIVKKIKNTKKIWFILYFKLFLSPKKNLRSSNLPAGRQIRKRHFKPLSVKLKVFYFCKHFSKKEGFLKLNVE